MVETQTIKPKIGPQIEFDLKPTKSVETILKERGVEAPRDGVLVALDPGTERFKYMGTNGTAGCFPSHAGEEHARLDVPTREELRKISPWPNEDPVVILGTPVWDNRDRLESGEKYSLLKPHEHGQLKADPAAQKNGQRLIRHALERASASAEPSQVIYALITHPPKATPEAKAWGLAAIKAYNDRLDQLGDSKTPRVGFVAQMSQPELIARGMGNAGRAVYAQFGAGTFSVFGYDGSKSTGLDEEINRAEETIFEAGNAIDRVLAKRVADQYGSFVPLTDLVSVKETPAYDVGKRNGNVELVVPRGRSQFRVDITQALREAYKHVLQPHADAIVRVIRKQWGESRKWQDEARQHIHIGGGGSQAKGYAAEVQKLVDCQFGGDGETKVYVPSDPVFSEAIGGVVVGCREKAIWTSL